MIRAVAANGADPTARRPFPLRQTLHPMKTRFLSVALAAMLVPAVAMANATIFQAEILSASMRETDPTIMDVVYIVHSDSPTVKVRALAFKNGVRSFSTVVRPETFVDGSDANIGDSIPANVEHVLSWKISEDWDTDLDQFMFEVLACEGGLLPLELVTIPATEEFGAMQVSHNSLTTPQIIDALLWLYSSNCSELRLIDGFLFNDTTKQLLACGTGFGTVVYSPASVLYEYLGRPSNRVIICDGQAAASFIFSKMGYSVLAGELLAYANRETRLNLDPQSFTAGSLRQSAVKMVDE